MSRARCIKCRSNIEGIMDRDGLILHPVALEVVGRRRISAKGRAYYVCEECDSDS